MLRSDKAAKAILNDNGPHLSNEHGNRHRFRCGSRLSQESHIEIPETLAAAQNNHRFNNIPVFTRGLTCLASKLSDLKGRNMAERNFSEAETNAKTGLSGVRNSTSGGKSPLQSAALVWTTDYQLMWKNIQSIHPR